MNLTCAAIGHDDTAAFEYDETGINHFIRCVRCGRSEGQVGLGSERLVYIAGTMHPKKIREAIVELCRDFVWVCRQPPKDVLAVLYTTLSDYIITFRS